MVQSIRRRSFIYLCLLCSFLLYLSIITRHDPFESEFHFQPSQPDAHPFESSCNFPILEDEDRSLKRSIKHLEKLPSCPLIYPHQMVNRSLDGSFFISTSNLSFSFHCSVQILTGTLRPNVRSMNISEPIKLPLNKRFTVNEDVFVISCFYDEAKKSNKTIFSRAYMGLKLSYERNVIVEETRTSEWSDIPSRPFDIDSLSISILVFDSTSRSQFARHMKKSAQLMKEMGFVTLLGYNKVGDNSAPNLSPILAEPYKENEEYDQLDETGDIAQNKFLPYRKKIDPDTIDSLWKRMKKKGCETLFNDDIMHVLRGLFHYTNRQFKLGFSHKPTDHYYRPFYMHLYKMLNDKWKICWDGRLLSEEFLVPWFLSLRNLANRCFFSFNFLTSPSHDNPNNLETLDEGFSKRLRILKNSGALSNTLLIVMGDHGQRMHYSKTTFAGRIEERQPLMSLLLPKEFRVQYPTAYNHLLTNVHRLTSNVDIHETLLDVIDNRMEKTRKEGRGRSLFTPIPTSRSCQDAWIANNFCLCQYNATEYDAKKYSHSQTALLSPLRHLLHSYPCLNTATVHCSSSYSLFHPHQAVRMGMRDKQNYTAWMEQKIPPKGFFMETRCTIRSSRNLPLTLLVRSRVDERGKEHSIPYPPMIAKADGECSLIKNLATFCSCEDAYLLHSRIEETTN